MPKYSERLEPCPFCGDVATVGESYEGEDDLNEIWIVSCNTCPAEMRGSRVGEGGYGKDKKEDLIKAWNKRV